MLSNRKQVSLAVGGSVLLHVLFLLAWAVASQWVPTSKTAAPTPPPIHLQVVKAEETPPPPLLEPTPTPTPTPLPFIDTSRRAAADHPPTHATFQSAQDSEAASELPAKGDQPLPTLDGRKSPIFAFDTTRYTPGEAPSLAMAAPANAPASPPPDTPPPLLAETAPVQPTPSRTAPPTHTPVPDDEFGIVAPTPTPEDTEPAFDPAFRGPASTSPPRPSVASRSANESDAAGFQPNQDVNSVSGNISKRGAANVDSVATPLGRYKSQVIRAISLKWYSYFTTRNDIISVGIIRIHIVVDRGGRVLTPRILSNSSNEALATVTLQAIMDAPIPPMPPETISVMNGGALPMDLTFIPE